MIKGWQAPILVQSSATWPPVVLAWTNEIKAYIWAPRIAKWEEVPENGELK